MPDRLSGVDGTAASDGQRASAPPQSACPDRQARKVTVGMPVFNGELLIARAIELDPSAKLQRFPADHR